MTEMQVIVALKRLLKQQGKTYKDVAIWLNLSEGSVKRVFTKGDMRLDRLMLILNHLGRDMGDLVSTINASSKQISQISEAQERELVEDVPTLLTAVAVLSQLTFKEIIKYYQFEPEDVQKYLLKLDKLRFISLLPYNRYQLNVSANFRWQNNGPIQLYFMQSLAINYMTKPLQSEDKLIMLGAMLSSASSKLLDDLIEEFMERFQSLNVIDRPLSLAKKSDTFMVLAKRRNWYNGDGL